MDDVSKSPYKFISNEINRQAERTDIQRENLNRILNSVKQHLDEMQGIIKKYNADGDDRILAKIEDLKETISYYQERTSDIYIDVVNSLKLYASQTGENYSDLSSSIETIKSKMAGL